MGRAAALAPGGAPNSRHRRTHSRARVAAAARQRHRHLRPHPHPHRPGASPPVARQPEPQLHPGVCTDLNVVQPVAVVRAVHACGATVPKSHRLRHARRHARARLPAIAGRAILTYPSLEAQQPSQAGPAKALPHDRHVHAWRRPAFGHPDLRTMVMTISAPEAAAKHVPAMDAAAVKTCSMRAGVSGNDLLARACRMVTLSAQKWSHAAL
jgi:hypothetical protein